MIGKRSFALALAGLAMAWGATATAAQTDDERRGPRDAIFAAADAAPAVVPGIFAMHVTATGREGDRVYLNSERDYRDQRNLTINIHPRAARALAERHGSEPDIFFRGRQIEIHGAARRMRIDFLNDRRSPTGLYYYQTHVLVDDADQIRLVD